MINEYEGIKELIEDLKIFLISDMPSKVFPTDRMTGKTMFREDYFESKKEIEDYLEANFEILEKQIKIEHEIDKEDIIELQNEVEGEKDGLK